MDVEYEPIAHEMHDDDEDDPVADDHEPAVHEMQAIELDADDEVE